MNQSESSNVKSYDISVRALAEHVHRSGGLSSLSFSGISGAEGTRLHKRIFNDLKDQYSPLLVETEVSLDGSYEAEDFILSVRGRADCVLHRQNGALEEITVTEIKSCAGVFENIKDVLQPEHWAQVMIYAHMYLSSNEQAERVFVSLRYVSIETLSYVEELQCADRKSAREFFESTCISYLKFAKDIVRYQQARDVSIREMVFPYSVLRAGQKDFMQEVITTISQRGILFTEAPTGIGKTISALYPAIKCLAHDKCDKIFYLTAKTSTRVVAQKALADMADRGLILRTITLQAKESMCPFPNLYCDTRQCPYAEQYYKKLPAAIAELMPGYHLTPEDVIQAAHKYKVCPHELSLDVSLLCDVIIGDYNHALNPRVKLERYFNQPELHHALLFDEAHNLVDRSRDMFTAALNQSQVLACKQAVLGMDAKVDAYLADLYMYFQLIKNSIAAGEPALPKVEPGIEEKSVMSAEQFRACRCVPKTLYKLLWKFCYFVRPVLDALPAGDIRKATLDFFFASRFFLTVLEMYFDDAYILSAEAVPAQLQQLGGEKDLTITLQCLDASGKIHQILSDHHTAVFFSATLSPITYYTTMLIGDKNASEASVMRLSSPFPPENLSVEILNTIQTTYKERMFTAEKAARVILSETYGKLGNFLVFLPSFAYLKVIADILVRETSGDPLTDVLIQKPSMRAKEKEEFLNRFEAFGERRLLAFAVLGGHFGEGIDLVGDRLSGVIIIGVGLPLVCPQREIMRQYFQEKFGDGFGFAYRFPGWEKVLQAAGRVIRDEEDTGFVLLMDERYKKPEYVSLFPEHWRPVDIEDPPN